MAAEIKELHCQHCLHEPHLYPPKTWQFMFALCGGHESETSESSTICAIYLSPTVQSRGHPGLFLVMPQLWVWPTEHMDLAGIAASSFYGNRGSVFYKYDVSVVNNQNITLV